MTFATALWSRLWLAMVEMAEALLPPGRRTEDAPLETEPATVARMRQRVERGLAECRAGLAGDAYPALDRLFGARRG
jgi:hypothetical protein